jgi:ribosomal protein L40E
MVIMIEDINRELDTRTVNKLTPREQAEAIIVQECHKCNLEQALANSVCRRCGTDLS